MVLASARALDPVRPASGRGLNGRTVVIDPGHGGPDGGARVGGIEEKEITLAVGRQLGELLTRAGVNVIYTRSDDSDLAGPGDLTLRQRKKADLKRRGQIGNSSRAGAFISIHANKFPEPVWHGSQTFFYRGGHPESKRLAVLIQEELNRIPGNTRSANQGVEVYLLKTVKVPIVTVEVGFMSNPEELRKLVDPGHQKTLALGIFTGVLKFFASESLPGPGAGVPGGGGRVGPIDDRVLSSLNSGAGRALGPAAQAVWLWAFFLRP